MNINHFDQLKDSVYNHPIFPLLNIVFNKCELATNSSHPSGSIDEDILAFIKQVNREQWQYSIGNSEIDHLMIQAIEILRMHFLEIGKVHELCENFCQKYIHLLKGKIPTDTIFEDIKSEEGGESVISSEDIRPMICSLPVPPSSESVVEENLESDLCEENDDYPRRRQKKRGIFPKAATSIMRTWLFQHLNHPYPSEEQKKILARETNLNILQVNNWFINARRRIVQPMIDQSNKAALTQKAIIGTNYHDLIGNNPYHLFDPSGITYGFQTNLYDDMTRASSYASSMHSNPFFTSPLTTPSSRLLSRQYGISPLSYHRHEHDD